MCSFKDMNGLDIEVGDKVEFWSNGYQEWRPGKVIEKRVILDTDFDDELAQYLDKPVVSLKTTATPSRIRSSKNIRKIL